MPHAESDPPSHDEHDQEARDDALIKQLVSGDPQNPLEINFDRDLDTGEKADDAVDYEDISDDDLADDEDAMPQAASAPPKETDNDALDDLFGGDFGDDGLGDMEHGRDAAGDDLDDLFGGTTSSPPPEFGATKPDGVLDGLDLTGGDEVFGQPIGPVQDGLLSPTEPRIGEEDAPEIFPTEADVAMSDLEEATDMELLQRRLFAMSNVPPAPPENHEELLTTLWPKFERNAIPRFMDLLPPKKARYVGKKWMRQPKRLNPTKISLDIAPDQEKSFKFSAGGTKRSWESMQDSGLVTMRDLQAASQADDDEGDADSDFENEPVGGVSWEDFQILCEDWDVPSDIDIAEPALDAIAEEDADDDDDLFGELDAELPARKRSKLRHADVNILDTPQFALPTLHDLEGATKRIARTVTLDLNDSQLLMDENQSAVEKQKRKNQKLDITQGGRVALSKVMNRRFNISNDPAYDQLKENHQSKVRSTLGQPTISHSMPAIRLQWPYYKTKLSRQDARSFHRPAGHFTKNEPITFQKVPFVKKKNIRGKDAKALFDKTEDLSLRDNSHMLLLEYSEEQPDLMSNFGMGSRVINYYRKKALDDPERPKSEIGELSVLLPQDKSPFSIFGHIDPGETTPAIFNGLYRAPVFEQKAKSSDFLMIRNSTGAEGGRWYMRTIEYLRVVGQLFPSQEVPRPNGRKVSTAAKNRVKMIAYRLMRRAPQSMIGVGDVTQHVSDSIEILNRQKADMQSRQKMKEFLSYSKEHKLWGMPGEAPVPDEESTRAALPPEDACLVEAVQVGQQHLEDAGFGGQEDDDDDGEEKSLEQQLAPWLTTKNFLTACAGKAMLQLHGDGDPTGRGEAFSFLKTSMKGGFKALGESIEDKLDAKKLKENNGHSYNVAKQAKAYEESIRRIWDAQQRSLSSNLELSDNEMDIDDLEDDASAMPYGSTPRPEIQTPSVIRRLEDDSASQFSKFSTESNSGKVLKITRKFKDENGDIVEKEEIVRDPKVIRQYVKRKQIQEAASVDLDAVSTADAAQGVVRDQLVAELNRLERNKERRLTREKQKHGLAASPSSPNSPSIAPGPGKGATTGRRCANCGQVGHIKTNKKLCPMLNGTMKPQDSFGDSAFSMGSMG